VPHKAYVEDADDDYHHNSHVVIVEPPPEVPSPPSAVPGFTMSSDPINVFDFLVDSETPNASRNELPPPEPMMMIEDSIPNEKNDRELVRVRFEDYRDADESLTDLVQYGSGPVQTQYETPAPKTERERERRRERKERDLTREEKKDKKRKRLHVETRDLSPKDGDEDMTDAPPVLHSGLTGGLNRLLSRPSVFPPSPDYSGGDANDASPGSPLKKAKSVKKRGRSRVDTISNNIMSLITTRREHSSEERPRRKHRRHREASARPAKAKMIEYKPMHENGDINDDSQVVLYKPRSELLLDFINKGPESERGMSMHKALKRYHRERIATGNSLSKGEEEKELWRSLRMKRNDRGEIVLFL
jgi:cell growth-regulating nucleolar protein